MNKIILISFSSLFSISLFAQSTIINEIDSLIHPYDDNKSPGFSIGVVKDGQLIYNKGIGLSNLEYGIKNSDSSVFDIASIAKQFTAACVWTLIEKGKVSLNDDIRKYLPELPFYGDTIRIRHMLNQTSGLRNYPALEELAGIDHNKEFFNNQKVFELTCRQSGVNNVPGERMLYINTPFNLLTIIIERITKEEFGNYAIANVFKPLGMNHTHYITENTSVVKNRAVGYIRNNDQSFTQPLRTGTCFGAGSLWSTVEDLVIWTNLFTQKNNRYQKLMDFLIQKDTLLSGGESDYARGVMIDKYKGQMTIHHSGITSGYRSQIISVPEKKISIIILANSQSIDPELLSYKILDLFITNTSIKKDTYQHTRQELISFSGHYQEVNGGLRMDVIFDNDTLKSKSSQGHNYISLVSIDKWSFYRLNNESVKYCFGSKGKFTFDLIIYFGATPFYFERINIIDTKQIHNNDYIGDYYSKELDVTYSIYEEKNKLYLSYRNNPKIELISGQKDGFGNGYRTNYLFIRDKNNKIVKLKVASEGTVKDIEFIKK
jgi:CubicO group peptidase (beta-lactamase class C family)